MLGERLKLAREAAGLSLRDLVQKLERPITAAALGKYERGLMMPRAPILAELSRVLAAPLSYLMSSRTLSFGEFEFRKAPTSEKRAELATKASLTEHMDRYLAVEDVLNLSTQQWQAPALEHSVVRCVEDAALCADELRAAWDLGTDPLPDMVQMLEERGIKIALLELPKGVFGCQVHGKVNDGNKQQHIAAIVLNRLHQNGERQRFTMAHELAHLVMDTSGLDEKLHEKAADRWAGEFLMPRNSFLQITGAHRTHVPISELIALKKIFGVSVTAVITRLSQLEVLPKSSIGQLWGFATKQGWKDGSVQEPAAFPPFAVDARLRRLVLRALAEDAISESRACELLRITRFALETLMEQATQ